MWIKNWIETQFSRWYETNSKLAQTWTITIGTWGSWVKEEISGWGSINPIKYKKWTGEGGPAKQKDPWWRKIRKEEVSGEEKRRGKSWDDEEKRTYCWN